MLLHGATVEEAKEIKKSIADDIRDHDFGTGNLAVKARTALVSGLSKTQTLTDALAGIRMGGGGHVSVTESNPEQAGCFPVPQVTLGACTRFRFEELESSTRNQFQVWREGSDGQFLEQMGRDITELLALRAEGREFDFVTAPPGGDSGNSNESAERLAGKVAELLEVPYRKVLVASAVSSALGHSEPRVAAPVKKGSYVLLVADLVGQGSHLRRCVEKLSKAGAFVQVAGWAAGS